MKSGNLQIQQGAKSNKMQVILEDKVNGITLPDDSFQNGKNFIFFKVDKHYWLRHAF